MQCHPSCAPSWHYAGIRPSTSREVAGGEGKPHCTFKEVGFVVAAVMVWGVFVPFVLDNNVMGLAETGAMSPPDPLRLTQEFSLRPSTPYSVTFPAGLLCSLQSSEMNVQEK